MNSKALPKAGTSFQKPLQPRDPPRLARSIADEMGGPHSLLERVTHPSDSCICMRDKNLIYCQVCGLDGTLPTGRVALMCPVHPNTTYLADYTVCPKCLAPKEFLVEVRKAGKMPTKN